MPGDFSNAARPTDQYDPRTQQEMQRMSQGLRGESLNRYNTWTNARNAYQTSNTAENLQAVNNAWGNLGYGFRTGINDRQKEYDRTRSFDQAKLGADQFRTNKDDYTYGQYEPLANQASMNLQNTEKQIKRDSNRRGLLGGPQMMGKIISARTQVASELMRMKREINDEASRIQNSMDNTVANIGLNSFASAQQQSAQDYERAMANALERRAAMNSLAGSVGYGVGGYLGQQNAGANKPREVNYSTSPGYTFDNYSQFGYRHDPGNIG